MIGEPFRVIEKKWGKEIWYALTKDYCLKKIIINKGHRTSLQYHEKKEETNVIISGKATVIVQYLPTRGFLTYEASPGDFFHFKPGDRHRFEALEDLVMMEASTIHVDDVVRISDDYNREGTNEP